MEERKKKHANNPIRKCCDSGIGRVNNLSVVVLLSVRHLDLSTKINTAENMKSSKK